MYELITSAKDTDDLSFGFHRDRDRRQRELTNNKKQKRKYHERNMFEDIFAFAEHHEKATTGLGYKLTLTRKVNNSVLNKANATIVGKNKSIAREMF